jgi:hypothetical protein
VSIVRHPKITVIRMISQNIETRALSRTNHFR